MRDERKKREREKREREKRERKEREEREREKRERERERVCVCVYVFVCAMKEEKAKRPSFKCQVHRRFLPFHSIPATTTKRDRPLTDFTFT